MRRRNAPIATMNAVGCMRHAAHTRSCIRNANSSLQGVCALGNERLRRHRM